MNPYVAWLKSNIPIVVFIVLMVAAAIVLPILSSGMNASLRTEVKARAANETKLTAISNARPEIPQVGGDPIKATGPINPKALGVAGEYEKRLSADAAAVRSLILTRNQQQRTLLVDGFFPNPPSDWRDQIQFQFYRQLMDKYQSLLDEVNAGVPPAESDVADEVRRADEIFRTSKLAKAATDQLTPEETKDLHATLQQARLSKYLERAQQLTMYASRSSINAPYWDGIQNLDLREVFDWQWQLWVKQDVLRALHQANEGSESLLQAPVKRVRFLSVDPLPVPTNAGSGSTPPPSSFGPSPAAGEAPAVAVAVPPDAKIEAPRDYAVSYTGRISNALYDVRRVHLQIVVDTARIPEVLDALGKQNLMTVIDLQMRPTDAFADLAQGYVYGVDITSDLDLTVETIWLREWTAGLMPKEVKDVLNPPVT